ncbi:MAG: hypothetical protein V3S69_05780 [Dehalococcoidales bacterium]
MEIVISKDTLSLGTVVVLIIAFVYSFLTAKSKDKPVNEELMLEPDEPVEEAGEVLPVIKEEVVLDEVLSTVEPDVADADVDAALEGVVVETVIDVGTPPISMVYLGIDMAQLPDEPEAKQIRWLREQMAALQPKGKKRSIQFASAGNRLKAWHLELGKQAAQAVQKSVSPVAS